MERLTAKRVNGIKTGYWSPAKKDELVHAEALKLWESRKERRRNKDTALLYSNLAQYFQSASGQKFLNELRQLLGRQRKEEEYLMGRREYRKRAET